MKGYWLVVVNRETGEATTGFYADRNTAWEKSIEKEDESHFTTVVNRYCPPPGRKRHDPPICY